MPWHWHDSDAEPARRPSIGAMLALVVVVAVVALVVWFGFMQPGKSQVAQAPPSAGVVPNDGHPGRQGQGEGTMKSSRHDEIEGRFHEAKGKVKEAAGVITDDPKLEAKGRAEKTAGKTQQKIGQIKKALGK